MLAVQHQAATLFKLGYKPVATLGVSETEEDDVSDDLSDDDDNNNDAAIRHHQYVPFVQLFSKLPPSAMAITGMRQRYHYHAPEALPTGADGGDSDDAERGGARDPRSGQERSVSFARASGGGDDDSLDEDADTSHLQGIVNEMMGNTRGRRGGEQARKLAGFVFNPHASRDAGLKRYCDFLRGDGIDYSKVDQDRGSMSSRTTNSSGSRSSSGTTVETKSALKRT